jgi:Protein of unknwon function (DUF3310)
MTKSAKIRRLLAKNLTAVEIAKQLKIPANYVYTVKWLDKKNKKKPSKIIKAVTEVKQALDVIEKKPTKLIVQPKHKDTAMKLLAELDAAEKKLDLVNKPPHYTDGGVDTLKFIEAKDLNYRLGNVVKYISRAGKKVGSDPVQDLEKARFYLEREIEARRDA